MRNCHILSAPWPSDSCVDARVAPACGYNRLEKKNAAEGQIDPTVSYSIPVSEFQNFDCK